MQGVCFATPCPKGFRAVSTHRGSWLPDASLIPWGKGLALGFARRFAVLPFSLCRSHGPCTPNQTQASSHSSVFAGLSARQCWPPFLGLDFFKKFCLIAIESRDSDFYYFPLLAMRYIRRYVRTVSWLTKGKGRSALPGIGLELSILGSFLFVGVGQLILTLLG